MDVETREVEEGTEISVRSDRKVAVVVQGEEERIYLPEPGSSDSTYYAGNPSGLSEDGELYTVLHEGEVDELEVFSK